MQLAGKVIVVTGAFGELGQSLTAEAIAQGAQCAMLGRTLRGVPTGAHGFAVDLASFADVEKRMNEVAAHFGRIDGLANVAGGFHFQSLEDSADLSEWQAMYTLNLATCANACRAALPHLRRAGSGRIVNVGAMGAVKAAGGMGPYAASKAGVMRLTESLADEVKLAGITVNAVLPSIIDTPQNRADMPKADASRWVRPQDLARVMCFLMSDASAPVTGALIPVTGRT